MLSLSNNLNILQNFSWITFFVLSTFFLCAHKHNLHELLYHCSHFFYNNSFIQKVFYFCRFFIYFLHNFTFITKISFQFYSWCGTKTHFYLMRPIDERWMLVEIDTFSQSETFSNRILAIIGECALEMNQKSLSDTHNRNATIIHCEFELEWTNWNVFKSIFSNHIRHPRSITIVCQCV